MIKLGANLLSQTVQRNLARSTSDLARSSERLASGQRINRASDDAAGLAISMSLNANARVFNQGLRNLNDGLSASSIADSALNELTNITQRIEELSVQSINSTFSDRQRGSMQQEVAALQSEWNRIVESTEFNGVKILTGENTRVVLQGGKGGEGTLAVQIGERQLAGGIEGFAGGTTRISTDSAGNQGNDYSMVTAMSADGRYVAFWSDATNLVAGDTNGQIDSFIKDTVTGVTTRISTDSAGNHGNSGSFVTAISADGRYVAFDSAATNLVAGDTNGQVDSFIKDTVTGVTTRISTDSAGNQANGVSFVTAMSADGRYVVFVSDASNLVVGDTNGVRDSFMKDTVTGVTTRISTDSAGNQANAQSVVTAMSADGRFVAFHSTATNLVAGDTNGVRDSFIKNTVTGVTTRISTDSTGNQGNDRSYVTAMSADGRYVAFDSYATNLVAGDTNGQMDSFIKDTVTGVTTRISTDSAGNQGNNDSYVTAISADGRYVAFDSAATNLVTGDTNGERDSFIKDTVTEVTTRISTDSAGNQGNDKSYVTAMSADGRFVALHSTATNLIAEDTNGVRDSFIKDLTRTGVQQMSGMVVSNRASAGITLGLVQRYRNELLDYRSRIGATTTRIETSISNLRVASENFKAAESRIIDSDVAQEAANATRTRILQQTASSLLGQANLAPQMALRLLQR